MKRLFNILLLTAVLSSLCGCEMLVELMDQSFITLDNVEDDKLSFGEYEDSFEVIFSTNSSWKAVSHSEWCRVEPSAGNKSDTKVIITVDKNTISDERKAAVVLSTDDSNARVIINVVQNQMTVLSAEDSDYELPDEGGTFTVSMKHNVKYKVSISSGTPWIKQVVTKAVSTSVHKFTVEPNQTEASRTATVSFLNVSDGSKEIVKVYQHGLPPKRGLVLKVTHINDIFNVPVFNEGMTGMVYWYAESAGDSFGTFVGYRYSQPDTEKTVTFDLNGYHNKYKVEFNDIKGIVEIDLSGL